MLTSAGDLAIMRIAGIELQPALLDQVHDRLLAAIVDGTLEPGLRLTQESIAERLGVSRQPVSHAIQVLRRRGLLVDAGKRGVAVAPIDAKRIVDLYQVREAIDALAAGLAAERIASGSASQAERAAADAALADGLSLSPGAPVPRLIDADVVFHSAIYALSGNAAISETVAEQWPHFMRSMAVALETPAMRARVWAEHADILAAIQAADAARARHLARSHTAMAGRETASRLHALGAVA